MAKKVKPYENNSRSRTLPNQSTNKNNNSNKNKTSTNKKKDLEKTSKFKFDDDFLDIQKSLDTSFLEGRRNDKKRDKVLKEKQAKARELEFLKSFFFLLSFLCVMVLIALILWNQTHMKKTEKIDSEIVEEEVQEIDDNYLFIGDSRIGSLPMDQFSYPYVILSEDGMTTESIVNDFYQKIYIYNPSAVLIEVGLEDLANESRIEDIKERYSTILKMIQENRPNASVYVLSLCPINPNKIDEDNRYYNMNNATIMGLNKELKDLAKTYHYTYVDLYSSLSRDNLLKDIYSRDGISLNKEGYKVVWSIINKKIEEKK